MGVLTSDAPAPIAVEPEPAGAPRRALARPLGSRRGAALRRLNERLEKELHRIAHSLHDEVEQLLAGVHIELEEVAREVPETVRPRLAAVADRIDEVGGRVRRIAHELRPTVLDDLGLVPALEFLAAGVARRGGLEVAVEGTVESARAGRPRLPAAVETGLYRIAQEALANVAKHAGARRAEVRLVRGRGAVVLSIRDDGAGFDVERAALPTGRRGLGLVGIDERVDALGGELRIESGAGEGTFLEVRVPLAAGAGDHAGGRRGGNGAAAPALGG